MKADPHAGLPQAATLEGQLAAESAARLHDADTPTIEGLQAALQSQGIEFGAPRQVLGRTQLALFCAMADGAGMIITVCEYPNADAATNGEFEANKVASKMTGHTSRVHHKSVLHVVARSDTPKETVDKVYAAFDSLPAADAGP